MCSVKNSQLDVFIYRVAQFHFFITLTSLLLILPYFFCSSEAPWMQTVKGRRTVWAACCQGYLINTHCSELCRTVVVLGAAVLGSQEPNPKPNLNRCAFTLQTNVVKQYKAQQGQQCLRLRSHTVVWSLVFCFFFLQLSCEKGFLIR